MSNIISLAELSENPTDEITWDLALPDYAPAEQIGLNLGGLRRIMQTLHIERVTVASYDGARSQPKPDIVGFDDQGTAYSGGTTDPSNFEEHRTRSIQNIGINRANRLPAYARVISRIEINSNTITDDIRSKNEELRSPKAWSKELNDALKTGVRTLTKEQLLLLGSWSLPLGITGGTALVAALSSESLSTALTNLLLFNTIAQAGDATGAKYNGLAFRERSLSLFYGKQLDRYVVAAGMLATTKLVKPIK